MKTRGITCWSSHKGYKASSEESPMQILQGVTNQYLQSHRKVRVQSINMFNSHKWWVFCDDRQYRGIWLHHCRSCWELQHRIHCLLCCQVVFCQLWNVYKIIQIIFNTSIIDNQFGISVHFQIKSKWYPWFYHLSIIRA